MTTRTFAAQRPLVPAMRRGLRRRCPCCGEAPAFRSYLKVVDNCAACGEPLGRIRADDFPPYLTILLVGHLVIPLVLWLEQTHPLSTTTQMLLWPTVTLALTLLFLPFIKGAVLGLMWALRLRGDERQ